MKSRNSLIAAGVLLAGCAGGPPVGGPYEPADYDETGLAGWYGAELAGRRTASGERFDPAGMTAAHRTLALGSHVEVTSVANGRNVVLRINDRGPYHGKRIIDLSRAAAQRLGISGVGRVRVRAVGPDHAGRATAPVMPEGPAAYGRGPFQLQVASFSSKQRARQLADRLDGEAVRDGTLWRVVLGPFKDAGSANAARADVVADGFGDAVIQSIPDVEVRTPVKTLIAVPAAALFLAIPSQAAAPPFDTPARVAYMKDLSSGAVLYAKNADMRMPPASMAKMMTVYVAFDLIRKGELKLDQMVTVRPETWRKWHGPAAGSTMFLSAGEQVSVENLLYGIVTLSGNDACVVLAEEISGTEEAFAQQMTRYAEQIGMTNSQFGNSNGWPDEGRTYVTAEDLTTLAARTIQDFPQMYKQFYSKENFTWGKTMGGNAITQMNRDPLLGRVAGADGLKTGHTEEAGYGFTGSADQNGRRIVMVLAGLDSYGGRAEESVKFMDWGFRSWQSRPLAAKGKRIEQADVQLGDAGTVGLVAPQNLAVTLPKGAAAEMRVTVVYNGPVKAPIKQGQHIADLVVRTPDMPPQSMPLVAETAVDEAGFFRRAWYGLTSLFG